MGSEGGLSLSGFVGREGDAGSDALVEEDGKGSDFVRLMAGKILGP